MQFAYQTDVGQRRKNNQDYVGVFTNEAKIDFAIVADGMGGHLGGDVASEMAVSHLGVDFSATDFNQVETIVKWLISELQKENERIIEKSKEFADLNGMGTTMVATTIVDHQIIVSNIGDSRAYLLRDGQFKQLTEDHSLVNELVKHGEITKEAAKHHPQKNVITRTLGVSDDADADVTIYNLAKGDYYLLCSDGLTNMVEDADIASVIQEPISLDEKCQKLVALANAAGGLDNITALLMYEEREVAQS